MSTMVETKARLLDKLIALSTEGRSFVIEVGDSSSYRTIYREGPDKWCYGDHIHEDSYLCESFPHALATFTSPPSEEEWQENLAKQGLREAPSVPLDLATETKIEELQDEEDQEDPPQEAL